MYQPISRVPPKALEDIRKTQASKKLILRDAEADDFKRIVCKDGKKPFTKENLISEINNIDSFPDYTLIPDKTGFVHVIYYGAKLTTPQPEMFFDILENVFGVVSYE